MFIYLFKWKLPEASFDQDRGEVYFQIEHAGYLIKPI